MAVRSHAGRRCSNGAGAGVVLSVLRSWRSLPSEKAREAAMPSLQASGIGHRRHDLPQHQASAEGLVPGDLPRQPEQGRGRDGRRLSRRCPLRRQARPRRGWQNALHRCSGTTIERRPRRIRLKTVKGFRGKGVERFAKAEIEPGSSAVGDGLSCWPAVTGADVDHFPMRTGSGRRAAQWAPFKWVDTVPGNIKTAITGTDHHVSPKHAGRYLASFACRFDRRYDPDTITRRLAWTCTQTKPNPCRVIIAGSPSRRIRM